jgi:hypothetical protein
VDEIARVRRRWPAAAAIFLIAGGVTWVLAIGPALIGFGLAVAAAMSWCLWLERHPDRSRGRPQPTPDGGTRVLPAAQDGGLVAIGNRIPSHIRSRHKAA